jgi:hypothetical protein
MGMIGHTETPRIFPSDSGKGMFSLSTVADAGMTWREISIEHTLPTPHAHRGLKSKVRI